MATSAAPSFVSGRTHLKTHGVQSTKSSSFVKTPNLMTKRSSIHQRVNHKLSIRAEYRDSKSGDANHSEFVAGFLLGSAIAGTIAYTFGPKIRKILLNEDAQGFRRPRRLDYLAGECYYDEGWDGTYNDGRLEKTRRTLNEKISQLNSAIDKVATRLRGNKSKPPLPVEIDSEEATI